MSSLDYAMTIYALWKVAYVLEYTYNTLYYSNKIRRLYLYSKEKKNPNLENELSQDWVYIQKDKNDTIIIQHFEEDKK